VEDGEAVCGGSTAAVEDALVVVDGDGVAHLAPEPACRTVLLIVGPAAARWLDSTGP